MPKQNKTNLPPISELIELIRAAKDCGLTKIKLGDFEAELSPTAPAILDLKSLPSMPGEFTIPHPSDFSVLDADSMESLGFAPTVKLTKPSESQEIETDPIDEGLFGLARDGSLDGKELI
jgi:hypothetical protein